MGQLLEVLATNPINYIHTWFIPKNYPKLIWNQQRSNVLGFGCLAFLLNTGWFSVSAWHKSTASPGHRSLNPSLSPLDKPRVVTFMINTCGGSKEGYQKPTAGYDIILYIWWYLIHLWNYHYIISSNFDVLGTNLRFMFHRWQDPGSP